MKIAVTGPSHPHRGGIARYTAQLVTELARENDVRLFSYSRLYPGWLYPGKSQTIATESVVSLPEERVLDQLSPLSWVRTARRIRCYEPDIVLIQWWTSFGAPCVMALCYLLKAWSRAPLVALCHNLVSHERRSLDVYASRLALSRVDGLLVQSDEDCLLATKLLPQAKNWRINHPVWVDAGEPLPQSKAKAQLNLSGKVVLFFGLVREHKGLADLVRAMPKVLESHDAQLLVVGEFWDDRWCYESLAQTLGIAARMRIVDRYVSDDEMRTYFSACDVVVLPYRAATQSGVVASAYAYRRPVVGTTVGGLVDVVRDGVSGRLVKPSDPESMAEGIVECLRNGAPRSYATGIHQMCDYLSWRNLVTVIEKVADELTTDRRDNVRGTAGTWVP